MSQTDPTAAAKALLEFIDTSPSPWHAAANVVGPLHAAGFRRLDEAADWILEPGKDYLVIRGDSSVIAFRLGSDPLDGGLRIAGGHTDSPGFRVKPSGARDLHGMAALGVEIYGGPIIATFADRDLTLAGRVMVEIDGGVESRLYHHPSPLVRLPTLAIHMNRSVNEEGLRFEPHEQLRLMLESGDPAPGDDRLRRWLAEWLDTPAETIQSWDLAVADTQPGQFFGPSQEFIANSQLDNLASCHAALEALLAERPDRGVSLIALFDHEEVGSESFKGAGGSFLRDTLGRIAGAVDPRSDCLQRMIARGWLLSVDMAHAWHPAFAGHHDEANAPLLNRGPVIKINAKQRYATDAVGEAYFAALCARAGVPCQRYLHRASLPCGSTIGPITAARLGLRAVDVGNPMWSMHSVRESAGALDHEYMIRALRQFFAEV